MTLSREQPRDAGPDRPRVLLGLHDADAVVAFGGSGTKHVADLLSDAARIAEALPPAFPESHVLLVFERDRYCMAAALLAAIARGHAVALPPTTRRESVSAVRDRSESVALLHDTDAGFGLNVSELLASAPSPVKTGLSAPIVPAAGTLATVFTSSSTGPMTAWRKSSAELLGEASSLVDSFQIRPGDRIVATVAPGHIYGLLFSVLVPLVGGAAFSRETPHHARSVGRCVVEHAANVLVSVPAQIRALHALEPGALSSLRRVFSSTGPLSDAVVRDFHERQSLAVTEIFGSTETGGIAWRERSGAGEATPWHPFDEVRLSLGNDSRLLVDSPFLHADLPRPFETGDRVRLHDDGTFDHLGRADGVVKIGGRRVSIREVEECIRNHPGVEEVAVVAVVAEGARSQQLLAAVVPETCDVAELKLALLQRFEPTCLPRRFVCLRALPTERNGKIQRQQLLRHFGLKPDGRPFNWGLEWRESKAESDEAHDRFEYSVALPEDYGWFDGHFDGYPVLAGAVQLKELVFPAIERSFPDLGPVKVIDRVKFMGRITKATVVTVQVSRASNTEQVSFKILNAGALCSQGTLNFAPEALTSKPEALTSTPEAPASEKREPRAGSLK